MPAENSSGGGGDDEAYLWEEFVAHGNHEARNTLIQIYLPLAKKIAAIQYKVRVYDDVEFEDYFQCGVVGLIEAIDRYRPDAGAGFETYATYRIKGAISNSVKRLTEMREQVAYRSKVIKERVESLSDENPLNLLEELVDIAVGLAVSYMLDGTTLVQEEETSHSDTPFRRGVLAEMRENVNAAIEKVLTEKERMVILYHYGHELTFELIADSLGLSKGRISQIHKSALAKLRDELIPELDECYA